MKMAKQNITLNVQLGPYAMGRLRCITNLVPSTSSPAYALDVGCGAEVWNVEMAEIIRNKGYTYVGLDVSKSILLRAKKSIKHSKHRGDTYLLGNACDLPCRGCFELVIALEIIEHLDNPKRLLTQIDKIMLEGSYLIISTPNKLSLEGVKGKTLELFSGKGWNAWGGGEHKHVFSSFEFLSLVNKYFSIIKVCGYHFLPATQFMFAEKTNSILKTSVNPFNKLGFQTIVLLKKAGRNKDIDI